MSPFPHPVGHLIDYWEVSGKVCCPTSSQVFFFFFFFAIEFLKVLSEGGASKQAAAIRSSLLSMTRASPLNTVDDRQRILNPCCMGTQAGNTVLLLMHVLYLYSSLLFKQLPGKTVILSTEGDGEALEVQHPAWDNPECRCTGALSACALTPGFHPRLWSLFYSRSFPPETQARASCGLYAKPPGKALGDLDDR